MIKVIAMVNSSIDKMMEDITNKLDKLSIDDTNPNYKNNGYCEKTKKLFSKLSLNASG